jgi:hypothetical protein
VVHLYFPHFYEEVPFKFTSFQLHGLFPKPSGGVQLNLAWDIYTGNHYVNFILVSLLQEYHQEKKRAVHFHE